MPHHAALIVPKTRLGFSDLAPMGIPLLIVSAWAFFSLFIFNGLASELFTLFTLYLAILAFRFHVSIRPIALVLFLAFVTTSAFSALISGEFWPALAANTHWYILPLATVLLTEVFRNHKISVDLFRTACAASIVYYLVKMYLESENYIFWRFVPVFGGIRHLGLSIGFLVVILYCKQASSLWEEAFFRIIRIAGLCLVFWSGGRTPITAWIICAGVITYGDRTIFTALFVETAVAAAGAMLLPPPYANLGLAGAVGRSVGSVSIDALSSMRITLWQSTVDYLTENGHIWWGAGGNGFIRIQTLWDAQLKPPGHIHPHNFIVQSLCEWGIVGTTAMLAFVAYWLPITKIKNTVHATPAAAAGVVYIVATGMLDATLYHLEHLIYLITALALCLSVIAPKPCKTTIAIPKMLVIGGLAAMLIPHLLSTGYRIGLLWYFPTN